jgi:hypothetical protein
LPLSADYNHMRCLYCGKELALLKRLTGGGEFCSEPHKQSYQEEYNRLALSRLLQAQSKPGDKAAAKTTSAHPPPPARVSAPVAVEEPLPVEEPVRMVSQIEQPEIEETAVPPEAGFSLEMPLHCALPDQVPYVEPWLESRIELSSPKWLFEDSELSLPAAQPVEVQIPASTWDPAPDDNNATPMEFNSGKVDLSMRFSAELSHDIPTAGAHDLRFAPKPPETNRTLSVAGPLNFRFEVVTKNSTLWERPQSVIQFPSGDTDVVFPDPWPGFNSATAADEPTALINAVEESEVDRTPRAALEALARLHQNMVAEQAGDESADHDEPPTPAPVSETPESEKDEAIAAAVASPEHEIKASPSDDSSIPSGSSDLLTIPLKTFPPSQLTLAVEADPLSTLQQATMPRMKAQPLRPKVSMAPAGYSPQPKAAPVPAKNPVIETKLKSGTNIPIPPRTENRPKPPSPNKPAVQQAKQPSPAQTQQSPKSAPQVKSAQVAATPQTQAPATKSPVPQVSAQAAKAPGNSPSTREPIKVPPVKAETPQPRKRPEPEPSPTADESTLKFETLELQMMEKKNAFSGSLNSKLIIAAVLVIMLAIVAFFAFGKKHRAVAVNPDQTESVVGPSIMIGEGGWVQNWSGDPSNAHVGRQITIYRPSLSLSDYRIEFQGQIDTKSVGWVFRAADPNNYYALKLAIVASGASPRFALFKYVVRSGRETEVGRVSLNLNARNDTIFNVRTDVRGKKFSTYVQGQPVDVWNDEQLKSGGVGFLNERTERARIKTVSIAYLTGASK